MRDFIYWRRRIEYVFFIPTNSKRNHTEFELSFTIDCMRDDSCLNSINEKEKFATIKSRENYACWNCLV